MLPSRRFQVIIYNPSITTLKRWASPPLIKTGQQFIYILFSHSCHSSWMWSDPGPFKGCYRVLSVGPSQLRSLKRHKTSKYPFQTEAVASSWLCHIWIKRRRIEKRANSSKQTLESMIKAATNRHMQITTEANISVTSLGYESWPKIRGPFDGC